MRCPAACGAFFWGITMYLIRIEEQGVVREFFARSKFDAVVLADALERVFKHVQVWDGATLVQEYKA